MMRHNISKSNESGVSESIGFMLIFTIVIAGIAIVTLYGYPLLLQQQLGAEEKIMEKNMIVLQNDMKSLAYKTVPYKETALKIGGGSLTVYNSSYNPSSSIITIKDSGTTYIDSFQPGELRYESISAQTDISLQNGAVVLRPRNQNGSTMLSEPRWFYDAPTKTLVINMINITSDTIMAKEGIGTVRMTLGETNYQSIKPTGGDVVIEYSPNSLLNGLDYSVGWDNFMKKTFSNQVSSSGGPPGSGTMITYTISPVDTLVIKKYEVKIEAI
jgi:hypothetical protein